jgi:CD2 antigen cytoplasmic tail-binding protein 2
MAEPDLLTSGDKEDSKQGTRFDPVRPGFIRRDDEAADEFEQDVGLTRKRKTVRTDGYDSDSSQEGSKKKKKKTKKVEDEDDDMFADAPKEEPPKDENEEEDAYGKLKRKKVNFVDYKAFEGQEVSDEEKDVESEEESVPSSQESGEEMDDEVGRAGSKKHAPKIEKFNLRQEQAEGVFTKDGGYVRISADPRAHQDRWMDGLTKGQIRRAKEASEKQRQRELDNERRLEEEDSLGLTERLERLIRLLQPGETPYDAMARLNPHKKKKWQQTPKWKKNATEEQPISEDDAAKSKEQIEAITSHADKLLASNPNIYATKRERLIILYQDEAGVRFREGPGANEVVEGVKWEYKWPGGDEVYTDFKAEDMRSWKEGGFFKSGVLCRRVGSSEEWESSADITF